MRGLFFFWMLPCLYVMPHWGPPSCCMRGVSMKAKSRLETVEQEDGENPHPGWCQWAAVFAPLALDLCEVIHVGSVGIFFSVQLLASYWQQRREDAPSDVTHLAHIQGSPVCGCPSWERCDWQCEPTIFWLSGLSWAGSSFRQILFIVRPAGVVQGHY